MRRTGSPSSCPALLYPLVPLSHFRVWVTVWVRNFWPTHKVTFCNKKSPKTEVFGDFWSCYPDSNWGPHPYQLTKGCCCLSFAILSCCRQSIVPQCFQGFFAAPYSLLSYLKKYCFLMPVSVLCRFLLETATSDLIPTHAILRPIRAAFLCSVRRIHELQRPGHSRGV